MAAIIFALFACAHSSFMAHKEEKRKEREREEVHARLRDLGGGGTSSAVNPIANNHNGSRSSPSAERARDPRGETLRAKAARRLHGDRANPSQLGDPISLTAESANEDAAPSEARRQQEDEAGSRPDSRATTLRGSGEGYERRVQTATEAGEVGGSTDGGGNGEANEPRSSRRRGSRL